VQEVDRIDDNGLTIIEGIVTSINRDRGQITVRYDNKTSEAFQLTNRAAKDSGCDLNDGEDTRVIVYYTNKTRRKRGALLQEEVDRRLSPQPPSAARAKRPLRSCSRKSAATSSRSTNWHVSRSSDHSRIACSSVSRMPGISRYSPRTRRSSASSPLMSHAMVVGL
jgi:hypothetical protein